MRRIGAHLSIAGAYTNAVDRAADIGATCLQIFSGSPRGWARRPLDPTVLANFKKYAFDRDIRPIFVHALYLINLAAENKELVQNSINALVHDLKFGSHFDCPGIIVHLGSHQGRGWEASREQVAVLIQKIIDEADSPVPLLIENAAGQKIGSDLSEIRWLLDKVNRKSLGWCYDTCHGWAAGYSADPQERQVGLFATLKELDLFATLACLHANDSRDGFGSRRDRHENIGRGKLGAQLALILNHPQLKALPLITEAPGLDGNGPDAYNVEALRKLST